MARAISNLKNVSILKPNKATQTSVDTILVTEEFLKNHWKSPAFQRPLRINAKVMALAEQIKQDRGVIPGVITIGVMGKDHYLLDGQHRCRAFILSGIAEGFCDVRYRHFNTMADMGEEFVNLNSALVRLRPDDILRGLEGTSEALQLIRKKCPFVGYDQIRRGERAPILGMSVLLRCWYGSSPETPASSGPSAAAVAHSLTVDEAQDCIDFILLAEKAWGRDAEYQRLWSSLNMTLCMWLYRRLVLTQYSGKTPKLNKDQFRACLMSLSAETHYLEWLVGRNLSERDRGPAYTKIKAVFAKRLMADMGVRKVFLPHPPWLAS